MEYSGRVLFHLERYRNLTEYLENNYIPSEYHSDRIIAIEDIKGDIEKCSKVVRAGHDRIIDRLRRNVALNKDDAEYVVYLLGEPPL